MMMAEKPPVYAPDSAPYVDVDFVITAGVINGIMQINVGVHELRPDENHEIYKAIIPTAHLRMTTKVAKDLIAMCQKVLDSADKNEPLSGGWTRTRQ
jgi:hypothetical protein